MSADDFKEFFDSDDDEFFVEVSNTFPDPDIPSSETLLTSEKHIPPKQERTISSSCFDIKKQKISLLENVDEIHSYGGISDISQSSKDDIKYVTSISVSPTSRSCGNKSNFENNFVSGTISTLSNSSYMVPRGNNNFAPDTTNVTSSVIKDDFSPATISARSSSSNSVCLIDKSSYTPDRIPVRYDSSNLTYEERESTFTLNTSFYINNRFTPGFKSKAIKRKFAGPAGLVVLFDESIEEKSDICESKKIPAMDNEVLASLQIMNFQLVPEPLSLISWQKLQSDVSSHASLHSTAKFYSIQRILHEASKKKLPKHMVVPVLCVVLKKMKRNESSNMSVFMDDTGEIDGRINEEVTSKFKEYIIEGAALILKKVKLLLNVLFLKTDNLVSIYLPDGNEIYFHNLESVLSTADPLKPLNCDCLKPSHQKENSSIYTSSLSNSVLIPNKTGCAGHCLKIPNKTLNEKSINRDISTSLSISKLSPVKNMRNDALKKKLSEDNSMDEFDKLLGNLDEDSFLGDL